ncbi:MAG: LptF/LptG family permease [Planctomycetota bacterium]
MPWTLYRYILKDMLKVLLLTTSVMVVVLSFGAAVQPLSEGLLGPVSVVKFVIYTMPTVLGFALPFAGAFAATLTFSRLVSDNEVLACRAGGLSYRTILMPVFGLGLILLVAMLFLSNTVVPGFWKQAKRTVEGDVLGILVARLNQGQPYIFEDAGFVLYADRAETRPVGSDQEAFENPIGEADQLIPEQEIVLRGIAFGQYDRATGTSINSTTARLAKAMLIRDRTSDRAYISLSMQDAVYYDSSTNELQSELFQSGRVEYARWPLPNPMSDEAVFFSFQQLMALKRNPEQFDMVQEAMKDLAMTIAEQKLRLLIHDGLAAGRAVQMDGGLPNEKYLVIAPRVEEIDGTLRLLSDGQTPVTIEQYNNDLRSENARVQFTAARGEVVIQTGAFSSEPEALILLEDLTVRELVGGSVAINETRHEFAAMGWPEPLLGPEVEQMSAVELGELAKRPEFREVEAVNAARGMLAYHIMGLTLNINAQVHARAASAVACLLLLLLGALMSLRLRGKTALVVFFWSFLLAILTLLMVYAGQNLAGDLDPKYLREGINTDHFMGLAVLWGGNLITLFFVTRLYLKVSRN